MFTELHPMDPPEESKLDLGIKNEDVLSRRDRLNKTTGIIVPYSMTRSGQHEEASRRKKRRYRPPLFTCDGIHFFSSKKLVVLYETHKENNLVLSKLVRKVEHQLTERDRFTFKQVQDSYDERTNKLAKLIREAQDERNKLKCKCPQTLESRIRHAKSKLRRDNMKKARLAGREPYLHEEWMKIQRKQDLRDEKRNADAINGSEADSDIDNDPVLRTRDDDEKKSFAHPWFNEISLGEISRLRLEYLMFMLAYDDVTDHSIDMEMARLLLEQRIKQEEQAKEEALKAFGAGGTEMEDPAKASSSEESSDGTDNETSQNPFADDDFFSESSESDVDGESEEDEVEEKSRHRKRVDDASEPDRESLVIAPTVTVAFDVVVWIVYVLINKVQYSTLEDIGRKMFCDLTGGSEGGLSLAISLLLEFECTMSFEDSIEDHELACRFENALHKRVRRFEKERKMDGFVKGAYDPCLKTLNHEWIEHEWYWSVNVKTNQPVWADASVVFIHASRIMPMGYSNKRGKVRRELRIQKAAKRIFKFFRLGPRWHSYVWRKRKYEKLTHLKKQYQWLHKGTIMILACPTDRCKDSMTRQYILSDKFNWEGPLIDLTGGTKTAEKFKYLERRELFLHAGNEPDVRMLPQSAPWGELSIEFFRKKTPRGAGLWMDTKNTVEGGGDRALGDIIRHSEETKLGKPSAQ